MYDTSTPANAQFQFVSLLLSNCLKMNKEANTNKEERAIKIKWYNLLFNDTFSDIFYFTLLKANQSETYSPVF